MILLAIGLYLAGAVLAAAWTLSHGPTEEWTDLLILLAVAAIWPFLAIPVLVVILAENRRRLQARERARKAGRAPC